MTDKYVLDENGDPRPEPDLLKWAQWYETANRALAQKSVGGYFVSTVFLGLDHNWFGGGPPILWETMIFAETGQERLDTPYDKFQRRYASKQEALDGHSKIVQMLTS